MNNEIKRSNLFLTWLAILTLGIQGAVWADDDDIERIFFFGDSLSDPGNIFALTGETSNAPYNIIPSAPYDFRGHQFSNGKTWAQIFARKLASPKSGKAALVRPGKFGNYAFGGARLRSDTTSQAPTATDQVNLFLADHAGVADREALYVLQFGGNDLRDALEALATIRHPDEAQIAAATIIQSAILEEIGLIQILYGQGARHFLVANAPNIGLAPAVRLAGPEAVFFGGVLAAAFNEGLAGGIASLQALPGISITPLDIASILDEIIEHPEKHGIRNTSSACIMFFVKTNAICRRPGKFVFWDGIHPTAKVHRILARKAARLYHD